MRFSHYAHALPLTLVLVGLLGLYAPQQGHAQVAGGDEHTCALLESGELKCWGSNDNGQLGLEDTNARGDEFGEMGNNLSAVNLGTDLTANQVSSGTAHTCAILDDDEVKCWGTNEQGELGLGDTQKRGDEVGEMGDNLPEVNLGTDRTASEITVGESQSCAILDNGELKCWGGNGDGELGLGDTNDRGDETGEMGDDLSTVDLGTSRTAATVAAGSEHTCALLDNSEVKCWGENVDGKLGLGDTESRGDEPGEMGDNLPAVDLGTNRTAAQIAVGDAHTCALLENGDVKCWGSGDEGGLGLGDTENRGDDSGEMGDDLPTVDLGAGRTAVDIAAGGSYTCAVLDNGEVKCWGRNAEAELGLGDTENRGDEPGEMGDNLPVVSLGTDRTAAQVITGESHTCVRFESKEVKCWGRNAEAELGLGDTENRGDAPGEMGDNLPAVELGGEVLPVEFVSFDGAAIEGNVRLTWQTASETNNAGFEVQRKSSGEDWTRVGYMKSKASGGTTTERKSYEYTIDELPVGNHQFRLRQVDLDGSSALTDPVSVSVEMQEALKLTAPAPNPVSNSTTLSFAVREQAETTVTLYNTLGQKVALLYEGTPLPEAPQTVQVDVSTLTSGTYFLRLQTEKQTVTRRMTVVR